jgi:ParB-like chromosome segregation protein Spo0J
MKKRGMVNPLLCIETEECEGQKYMCCIGNNRYLAALELGIKEVPIKIVTSEVP